jgi:phage-related holin
MDMRNDSFFLKSVFAVAVTTLQFLFGGWSMPLQILVAVVIIDYLTGIGAAFVSKRLDSLGLGPIELYIV